MASCMIAVSAAAADRVLVERGMADGADQDQIGLKPPHAARCPGGEGRLASIRRRNAGLSSGVNKTVGMWIVARFVWSEPNRGALP